MKPISLLTIAISLLAFTSADDESTSTDSNGVVHITTTKRSVIYKMPSAVPGSPLLLLATEDDLTEDPAINIQARQFDGTNSSTSSSSSTSSFETSSTPESTTSTTSTTESTSSTAESTTSTTSSSSPSSSPTETSSSPSSSSSSSESSSESSTTSTTSTTSSSASPSPSPTADPSSTSSTSSEHSTSSPPPSSVDDNGPSTSIQIVTQIITESDSTSTVTLTTHSTASTSNPSTTSHTTTTASSTNHTPVIVGTVVGVVGALLLAGLGFVGWRIWGKKKFRREASPDGQDKTSFDDDANVFRTNVDQYHTTVINNPAQNF